MVIKMEEPGSKQMLAAKHGCLGDVAYDLVNHLINDTICVGAKPLAIQDTIVCGNLEPKVVVELVDKMAKAARLQNCDLVGGETSEQPGVLEAGTYILSAACVGIVSKSKIIDGSAIKSNQKVYAISSSGIHTNGYTLVRKILDSVPDLANKKLSTGETVLESVLVPHRCYNLPLQELFAKNNIITGLAHITGGGVVDNLKRILPKNVKATINLDSIEVLEIFKVLKEAGNVPADDMLRTFNLGVGMILVAEENDYPLIKETFDRYSMGTYCIGSIEAGDGQVEVIGTLAT